MRLFDRARATALRLHRRTERLPRLPFTAALILAAVLLAASIEAGPNPDARVDEVDELELPDGDAQRLDGWSETEVEIELVEYGFGALVDPLGRRRVSVGAVLRNPHDHVVALGPATVLGRDDAGVVYLVEEFHLGWLAPESEVLFGRLLSERPSSLDVESLTLEVADAYAYGPEGSLPSSTGARFGIGPEERVAPRVGQVELIPLSGGGGYRVVYEVIVETEEPYAADLDLDVVFRDGEGRIVGGRSATGAYFDPSETASPTHVLPAGTSVQHFDLYEAGIPPGADLARMEIGPGT